MDKFNGRKLRYIREQRGVSQLELSKACEVPQSLLSKYERGEVKSPPASAVQAFADYFNVAYGYFFGDVNSISLELSYLEMGLILSGLKALKKKTKKDYDPNFVPEDGSFDENLSKLIRCDRLLNSLQKIYRKGRENG
jgi:transcriptional regulator with XRE-family HTH domain